MSQPDKVKVWKQEGAEGGQVSEAGGRQQGSKGQELRPGYKGPQRTWKVGAACSLYREATGEFSSEGEGCDLIFGFKRSPCLRGNRRAEVEEGRPMEKLF